jgi:hypothetical protein
MCYLFSADDNGHLYRAETTVGEFSNGSEPTAGWPRSAAQGVVQ